MDRRGRQSKNRNLIIHALVKGLEKEGVFRLKLTRGEISSVMGNLHESSLQVPLKKLVDDGVVTTEVVDRRTREPPVDGKLRPKVTVYYLDRSKWRRLMLHYFPPHGITFPDDAAAKNRAEFLASDYADEMFQPERFYEIIIRVFLKWCLMLDKDTLHQIHGLLARNGTQERLREYLRKNNRHIDDESVMNAYSILEHLFQQLDDLKVDQRMPADSFFETLEDPQTAANVKMAVHFLLGMKDEALQEMSALTRLTPSFLSYVLRHDVDEGMPPVFLFDVPKLKMEITNRSPTLELWKKVQNEFNIFLWRLLFVKLVHDMIDYPEVMTIRLFKKAGLYTEPANRELTLTYIVEKVARRTLPTNKSLRNRLQ